MTTAKKGFRKLEPKRINFPITSGGHALYRKEWKKWYNKYIKPIY